MSYRNSFFLDFFSVLKISLFIFLIFGFSHLGFSQSDTPCAASLYTLGTSCNYLTFDASVNTKSTTATAPNPTCPNNQYSGSLAEEDTWYAFVVPASGSVIISTARTAGSVYPYASAAVYSGACSSLTEIDCFGGYGGSSYPSFNLTGLTPGNTYYVRFWGLYANGATSPKTHDFCAYAPPTPPANDECNNAIPAVVDTTGYCNSTTPGTIDGATQSPESYYCSFAGGGDANDDVWFSFVAIDTIQYFFLENIVGSTTDLSFSVHAGTFCNSSGVNSLACNQEFVQNLVLGNTYYVRVWSNSSVAQNSTFDLCITAAPIEPPCASNPVAGNTACTATPICNLDGYCGTTSSTYTEDSWSELDVAALCFPDIDNNSFLELTASDTAIAFWVWVDNCNFPNGIQIMVFSADSCGNGPVTRHSCWSPGYIPPGAALVRADGLTIGDTYYIMVDGNAGAVCDYTIAAYQGFQTAVEVNSISGDTSICLGSSIDLYATGGSGVYSWSPATALNNTINDTVTSTPTSAGSINYIVTSSSSVAICPSDTAAFNLIISSAVTSTDVQSACGSFTWIDGNTYSSNNNTAMDTIVGGSASGCDSIITLDLTITSAVMSTDVQSACGSFTWIDGNTYSSNNNTAMDTIVGGSVSGCDSIIMLDLTITSVVMSTDVQSACGSFTWIDGNTYSSNNNTAMDTIVGGSVSGCDSIITLDLTITSAVMSTDVQSSCGSFTWIDGNTYSSNNNTAMDTIFGGSVNGCDSIITLDLTITSAVTSTDVQSVCGSFTWINGNTYISNNNTAMDTIFGGSVNGCDSIITLDLTITSVIMSTDVQTACGSFTWIDGNTYSSNNDTAMDTIFGGSVNGCDSIITLDLTISTNPVIIISEPSDLVVCPEKSSFNLEFNFEAQNVNSYQWQIDTGSGYQNLSNTLNFSGTMSSTLIISVPYSNIENGASFRLVYSDNCGNSSISNDYQVQFREAEPFMRTNDQVFCTNENNIIEVDYNGSSYSWNDSNNTGGRFLSPIESGEYIVRFIQNTTLCEASDTILVTIEDCIDNCVVSFPTGFSPNSSEGFNDVFKVVTNCEEGFSSFSLSIYNRWGDQIYFIDDYTEGWDGSYKNKMQEIGIYTYTLEYIKEFSSEKEFMKGTFSLIR